MSLREELQDEAARTGQRVNEDKEGEKGAGGPVHIVCAHTRAQYQYASVFVSMLIRALHSEGSHPRPETRLLTKSVDRSFMPRTLRTRMRGIMLMYHGMDEIKGTDCSAGHKHKGNMFSADGSSKCLSAIGAKLRQTDF